MDTGALSTLPSQARVSPNWKEQVNQRIAAHKNRKPVPSAEQNSALPEQHTSNDRAAAAARVAARFANAPRYSEVLENEARAAVRAAEAVSRAALQAQAVAESVLAELQAAKAAEPEWQFQEIEEPVAPQYRSREAEEMSSEPLVSDRIDFDHAPERDNLGDPEESHHSQSYEIRWEPDAPRLRPEAEITNSRLDTNEWRGTARFAQEESLEMVEPAQPIHANLIEFPREIVATRKARPRRAEGPFAAQQEHDVQLSIFEVEPETISIDPEAAGTLSPEAAPTWMSPEWSGMELDEHPVRELYNEAQSDLLEEPVANLVGERGIYQAPLTLRAMAAVVDGSLVLGMFSGITLAVASRLHALPGMRAAELGAAAAMLLLSALYLGLFIGVGQRTPGMCYARIALSTFEGEVPSRRMRLQRLAALVASVLPVGVGVLWSMFDEDHLSWHDRLSGTYLRTY
jgi:uncharacterized RDD family membrane protein YckC